MTSKKLKIAVTISIAVCIIGIIGIFGTYAIHFGRLSNFTLSSLPESWGAFGSYSGGLLGPFFAFMAFIGVLFTISLQKSQLDIAKKQARLEELQRVISNVSKQIDEILNAKPRKPSDQTRIGKVYLTVLEVISAGGTGALKTPKDWKEPYSKEFFLHEVKNLINTEIGILGIEFDQLAWCLEHYELVGGDYTVVSFYHRRYRPIICWLDAMGYFKNFERIQRYFKPRELQPFLRREQGYRGR